MTTPVPGSPTRAPTRRRSTTDLPVWRWPVLAFLVVALVCAGLVDRAVGTSVPTAPAVLAAAGAPYGSESSSWYCTGGTGNPGGDAGATLDLVNSGSHAVHGTVTVVDSGGGRGSAGVTVPAGGQSVVATDQVVQGSWLAATVDLDGGGVVVSETVEGPSGWAEAPCATTTSRNWYFASGATSAGNSLYVSLYNPTAAVSVVDLGFVTRNGLTRPQPFEGLVVAPGAVVVAEVASYVQDQRSVATVVQSRSGRVVATELQVHEAGGTSGLSLRLGSPVLETAWSVPRTVHVTGSTTALVVFNPSARSEQVTVRVQLPSGPVAPYVHRVAPDATWTLATSSSTRIPAKTDFATSVTVTGGPGVVVDRQVVASTAAGAPQWGTVTAVAGPASGVGSRRWVLPTPAAPATPAEAGAAPYALALQNPNAAGVTVTVGRLTAGGVRSLGKVPVLRIPGHAFIVIEPTAVGSSPRDPLVITATGPVAVMEDATPAGMPGVVALAALPQRT